MLVEKAIDKLYQQFVTGKNSRHFVLTHADIWEWPLYHRTPMYYYRKVSSSSKLQ